MRIGRFYISKDHFIDGYAKMADVFCKMKFVPTRAEFLWDRGAFEYIGYSFLFEEVPEHGIAPEYSLIITEDIEMAELEVKVEKVLTHNR